MNHVLPPMFWQLDESALGADELIVDSFAGGGGASTGIELALGRSPDYAINHDPEALALHAANHPSTVHLSKNIYKVDPIDVVGRRKVGLLWASPDCKHFSKAKGGKPVKREIRDLAWTVVLWAERVKPRVIILENVEEFQTWGPLVETEKGVLPDPARKGETFNEWIAALKKHGYKVEWKELRACDYGAPTTRKRLFLIARCDRQQIKWPYPTHGAPTDPDVISGRKLPWVTAAEIIDWSEPCPSIFDTSDEIMTKYGVRAVRPLAENTLARIAKGIDRYVLKAAKPFVVGLAHRDESSRSHGLEQPITTIHAGGGNHSLVSPVLAGVGGRAGQSRPRSGGEPTATSTTKADTVLVAPVLTSAQHGGSHRSADEPHRTIAASDKDQNQVVAAHLQRQFGASVGHGADEPNGSITAGGGGKSAVVAAFLAQHNTDMVGHHPAEPVSTIVQKGCTQAVVAAHLLTNTSGHSGATASEPVATVTTGRHHAIVSAGLMNMKGSDRRMSDIEAPTPTVTADGNHVADVRAFLTKYYGVDQDPRLEEPLATVTTRDRFGLVTIEGEEYQITDIGMRMLTPRELFRAQGFPAGYQIEVGRDQGGAAVQLTKTAQVRMCGNSVCPPIAAALVRANCGDMARRQHAEAA